MKRCIYTSVDHFGFISCSDPILDADFIFYCTYKVNTIWVWFQWCVISGLCCAPSSWEWVRECWIRLCCKCERVYARYGTEEIPTDIDDPWKYLMPRMSQSTWCLLSSIPCVLNGNLIHLKSISWSENVVSICGETTFVNFGDPEEKKEAFYRYVVGTVSRSSQIR